ncbi:CRP/FNR family transcriptional regulator, anaerobic regulatory protein [Flavobacteriaceae bacterium MAR_2010_188]|nr:CRP/FNR family transcriptional regulator, anaerobic regulatory protein [Flavobacteriaceae bacterium MAR_2010_188]
MTEILKKAYGNIFEDALLKNIEEVGVYKEVSEGEIIMNVGTYVRSMPLLLEGAIKILRHDDDGDELLLYFLEKGDTCAMTLSCCMGQTKSEIKAIAETDSKLIMIPIEKMESWTAEYKSWRNFVFQSYHDRFMEMLETVDTIAFMNMDQRLIKYLESKAGVNKSNSIATTHQQIAYELNTSRVVISRLLKKLENDGLIELQRNNINLLHHQGLN